MRRTPDPTRPRRGPVWFSGCLLGLLLAIAATGCGAEEGSGTAPTKAEATPSYDPDVTVIQPGGPGEPATTGGPSAFPEASEWNKADTAFVQMMIPHHQQALTMSELAETRATREPVRVMASRISSAQGPEVTLMTSWLQEHNLSAAKAGHTGHDLAGMLTPAEMRALEDASGPEFDKLFLAGMIRHHEGAVEMAQQVAVNGTSVQVGELAADIDAGQRAEIARLRDLQAG